MPAAMASPDKGPRLKERCIGLAWKRDTPQGKCRVCHGVAVAETWVRRRGGAEAEEGDGGKEKRMREKREKKRKR